MLNKFPISTILYLTVLLLLGHAQTVFAQDDGLWLQKSNADKKTLIRFERNIKLETAQGELIIGKILSANEDSIVVDGNALVIDDIVWLRRRMLLKPLAYTVAIPASVFTLYGVAGYITNVGKDDTWSSLGAVVGALFAISGGLVDLITLPVIIKGRKYYLQGEKAKWEMLH